MTSVNGQVRRLNPQAYQALQKTQTQRISSELTAKDATQITEGILKDGVVDAAEADLLDEILTQRNEVKISKSSRFDANSMSFSFSGVSERAKAILNKAQVKRLTGNITKPSFILRSRQWKAGQDVKRTPSGVMTNREINSTYNALDQRAHSYSHGMSNWMTFGKYASREAGSQIANLEAAYEMLETMSRGNVSSVGEMTQGMMKMFSPNGDGAGFDPLLAKQGVLMFSEAIALSDESLRPITTAASKEMHKDPLTLSDVETAIETMLAALALKAVKDGNPEEALAVVIAGVEQLHQGLVEGNTGIYENIAPAFDIFLEAEAKGEDGIAALQKAGYGAQDETAIFVSKDNKDPQGFVVEAFKLYKEVHEDMESGDPVRMAGAKDKQHRANLMIGAQEQMAILQRPSIFGDPLMSGFLHAMNGTMGITDANGPHPLLPNHGPDSKEGWSDFPTRMGLKEVSMMRTDAIAIRGPESGETHYYVPRESIDPASQGTISEYFANAIDGEASDNLVDSDPRPIYTAYAAVDLTYKGYPAQISSSSVDDTQYPDLKSALQAAKGLQDGAYVDSYDYGIVQVGNKYEVRNINTFAYMPDDISDASELNDVSRNSDIALSGLKAIVSDEGRIRTFSARRAPQE